VLVYVFTKDLVYTFVISVIGSTIADRVLNKNKPKEDIITQVNDKIKFQKPIINLNVIRGVMSLICITIGGNIAFTNISAGISGVTGNSDHVSIYSGLADAVSSMFGGSPISIVLSPTAAAPNPKWSAVILMAIMAILLGTGIVSKIAKFIPSCSVSGSLFVMAIIMSLPGNLQTAFVGATAGEALAGSIAMIITALVDPFFGMAAGIVVNLICVPLGLA
ncbi:MAG: NCS2 family permease, partial [Oscillospiraceae bacterium]